ncbi:hypothetical protein PGB90_003851 [Kerria lacca]
MVVKSNEEFPLKMNYDDKINLHKDVPVFYRKRYYISFLAFFGMVISVLLRTNLSIAIVEMTSNKTITEGNETRIKEAEFNWSSVEKGLILSSFSFGYFFSPLGGMLASKYGGVTVFGVGIMITSVLTMLSPIFVRLNTIVFMIGRIFEGIAESCSISGSVEIFVHWAPENEKSRLVGIGASGFYFGAALAYPICGFAASLFGWEAMFVITGGISLLWYFIWFVFVSNDPSSDKFISKKEKLYLAENVMGPPATEIKYPWASILTSRPVWAFFNERLIAAWLVSFTIYCLPLYIKDVLNVDVKDIGLISFIPNFSSFLALSIASFITDYVRNLKIISISNVHKLFFTVAKILSFIILVVMILSMDFKTSIVCLTLFRFCYSFSDAASSVLPIDLAPYHAGLLVGLSTVVSSVGYVINPIILGFIVRHHSVEEWRIYFALLCCCIIWAGIIFCIFGSGELEPWAKQKEFQKVYSEDKYEKEMEIKYSQ